MPMSIVRQDKNGLYIKTGGHVFRPGAVAGYDHAYDMTAAGIQAGDRIKVRHMGGTPLCRIQLASGEERAWHTEQMDRGDIIIPPGERADHDGGPSDPFGDRLASMGVQVMEVRRVARRPAGRGGQER